MTPVWCVCARARPRAFVFCRGYTCRLACRASPRWMRGEAVLLHNFGAFPPPFSDHACPPVCLSAVAPTVCKRPSRFDKFPC